MLTLFLTTLSAAAFAGGEPKESAKKDLNQKHEQEIEAAPQNQIPNEQQIREAQERNRPNPINRLIQEVPENPERPLLQDQGEVRLQEKKKDELALAQASGLGLRFVELLEQKNVRNTLLSFFAHKERLSVAEVHAPTFKCLTRSLPHNGFFSMVLEGLTSPKPGSFCRNWSEWSYTPKSIQALSEAGKKNMEIPLLSKGPTFINLTTYGALTAEDVKSLENLKLPLAGNLQLLAHPTLWPYIVSLSLEVSDKRFFSQADEDLLRQFADHRRESSERVVSFSVSCAFYNNRTLYEELEERIEATEVCHSFFKLIDCVTDLKIGSIKKLLLTFSPQVIDSYQKGVQRIISENKLSDLADFSCLSVRGLNNNDNIDDSINQSVMDIVSQAPHLEHLQFEQSDGLSVLKSNNYKRIFENLVYLKHFSFCGRVSSKETFEQLFSLTPGVRLEGDIFLNIFDSDALPSVDLAVKFFNHFDDHSKLRLDFNFDDKNADQARMALMQKLVQRKNLDFSFCHIEVSSIENLNLIPSSTVHSVMLRADAETFKAFVQKFPKLPKFQYLGLFLKDTLSVEEIDAEIEMLSANLRKRYRVSSISVSLSSFSLSILYRFLKGMSDLKEHRPCITLHYNKAQEEESEIKEIKDLHALIAIYNNFEGNPRRQRCHFYKF